MFCDESTWTNLWNRTQQWFFRKLYLNYLFIAHIIETDEISLSKWKSNRCRRNLCEIIFSWYLKSIKIFHMRCKNNFHFSYSLLMSKINDRFLCYDFTCFSGPFFQQTFAAISLSSWNWKIAIAQASEKRKYLSSSCFSIFLQFLLLLPFHACDNYCNLQTSQGLVMIIEGLHSMNPHA